MKTLLVYPVELLSFSELSFHHGIGIISSLLKKANHSVNLYIPNRFNKSKIDRIMKNHSPDLVGISSTSDQIDLSKQIIKYINEKHGNMPIILGGVHPTVDPDDSIKIKGLFSICIGEGEYPFLELVDALEKKEDFTKIKNFWFKINNKIIKNEIRPLIKDLDTLPFPDRDIFNYQKIINSRIKKDIEIMCSRGCPYDCSYCINRVLKNKYKNKGLFIRRRSIKNIIKEIQYLKSRYKFSCVTFHDDTFTLNSNWVAQFCKEYKIKINIPFFVTSRPDTLNEGLAKSLKEAGCVSIMMGIESGNEIIRNKILNRNISTHQIINAFSLCRKFKINTIAFNMLGIPFEDESSIEETIKLNKEVKPTKTTQYVFRPYFGTELYNLCNISNWISDRKIKSFNEGISILDLPTITRRKIMYYQNIFRFEVNNSILLPIIKILARINLGEKTLYLLLFPFARMIYRYIRNIKRFLSLKWLKDDGIV